MSGGAALVSLLNGLEDLVCGSVRLASERIAKDVKILIDREFINAQK